MAYTCILILQKEYYMYGKLEIENRHWNQRAADKNWSLMW